MKANIERDTELDARRLKAFASLEDRLMDLDAASYVLDRLAMEEFESARTSGGIPYEFTMLWEQQRGLSYMIGHVRDLVVKLDCAYGAADRAEVDDGKG